MGTAINPVKYVQETVRNCTAHLAANYGCRFRLPKKAENQFKMGYDPGLNISPELGPNSASYYLTGVGIQRWMLKLGRINIINEVSSLSSHIVLSMEGHSDAAMYVMALFG